MNHHNNSWVSRLYNLYEGITSVKIVLFLMITAMYFIRIQPFDWVYAFLCAILIAPRAAQEVIYAWRCVGKPHANQIFSSSETDSPPV